MGMMKKKDVPNLPCGVERQKERMKECAEAQFLIYRVELKEFLCPDVCA